MENVHIWICTWFRSSGGLPNSAHKFLTASSCLPFTQCEYGLCVIYLVLHADKLGNQFLECGEPQKYPPPVKLICRNATVAGMLKD
jgi:hypothetical protein